MIDTQQNKQKTKEHEDYEKAVKHIQELSLRKSLSDDGIDTYKLPRLQLDEIKRIIDKRVICNSNLQQKIQKMQQEAQVEMIEIDKELRSIIDEIKKDQCLVNQNVSVKQEHKSND